MNNARYAVIFTAEIDHLDDGYSEMAKKLRALAEEEYACVDFTAVSDGHQEIAISYWQSLEDIRAWKNDRLHLDAQRMGKEKWYRSYKVQVVRVC